MMMFLYFRYYFKMNYSISANTSSVYKQTSFMCLVHALLMCRPQARARHMGSTRQANRRV